MDKERIWSFIEMRWKYILGGLVATISLLILVFFGGKFFKEKETGPMEFYEELQIEEALENTYTLEEELATEVTIQEIIVDVKGAVLQPGVYKMTPNSRVIDAIEMAGGINSTAEEKQVNFAQKVEDQMVIYVPEIGEETEVNLTGYPAQLTTEKDSNLIDINYADKDALMQLNGIGSSKADSILQYREENGNFQSIDEIKNVSGIGDATFEKLKEFIKVVPN